MGKSRKRGTRTLLSLPSPAIDAVWQVSNREPFARVLRLRPLAFCTGAWRCSAAQRSLRCPPFLYRGGAASLWAEGPQAGSQRARAHSVLVGLLMAGRQGIEAISQHVFPAK